MSDIFAAAQKKPTPKKQAKAPPKKAGPKTSEDDVERILAQRDFWRLFLTKGSQLHGFNYRHAATFYRDSKMSTVKVKHEVDLDMMDWIVELMEAGAADPKFLADLRKAVDEAISQNGY